MVFDVYRCSRGFKSNGARQDDKGQCPSALLRVLVPFLLESLPDYGEGEALKAVSNDPSAEATTEESGETIGVKDHSDGLSVTNGSLISLLGSLDDAEAVTAAIRDDR